jgi:hypothetical protein
LRAAIIESYLLPTARWLIAGAKEKKRDVVRYVSFFCNNAYVETVRVDSLFGCVNRGEKGEGRINISGFVNKSTKIKI